MPTNYQMTNKMSTPQAVASSRFLTAMGPMINDESKMAVVINYINAMRHNEAPCRFTETEIRSLADKAEHEYATGSGMVCHEDWLNEIATWQG